MTRSCAIKILAVICSLLVNLHALADNLVYAGEGLSISLLTCAPSEEIYAGYGHSALRVKDDSLGIDEVFNYGTFDFQTPHFVWKFLSGTLDYMLSTQNFSRFSYIYEWEGRQVVERRLILSSSEKVELLQLLMENQKPENRFYRYDFFFDNCATRIRDIVFKVHFRGEPTISSPEKCNTTFRDCLHEYVGPNTWLGTGIDLILGIRADYQADELSKAFIPDHLAGLMDNCNLCEAPQVVVGAHAKEQTPATVTPRLVALALLVLTAVVIVIEKRTRRWLKAFDVLCMLTLSLLAILFWFLWLFSEIKITTYNLNVLWASILYIPLLIIWATKGHTTRWAVNIGLANLVCIVAYWLIVSTGIQYPTSLGLAFSAIMALRTTLMLTKWK